jgi:hypothetical protein
MTRRPKFLIALLIAMLVVGTGTAYAFWTAGANGNAAASADSLNSGATPTGSVSGSSVTLNWTASTTVARGAAVDGYVIKRYTAASGGIAASPGGTCAGTVAALNCQDTGLADGTYYYSIAPEFGNWLGDESPTRGGPFTVSVPVKLDFTTQPSTGQNIQATGTGTFSVAVAIQNASNSTVTSETRNVTLAIDNNPGSGTLTCATGLTVAAVSGVANFTGCAITKAGNGYTLTATSSPSLTAPNNANAFNITAGTATQLGFTTQPGGGTGGTAWVLQPVVAIQDTNGNTATAAPNTAITLAILNNAGPGGVLSCTANPVTTSSGVATFAGCRIDKAGTGYTIRATGGSFTQADSNAFDITTGVAAGIVLSNVSTAPSPALSQSGSIGNLSYSSINQSNTINRTLVAMVSLVDAGGNLVKAGSAQTIDLSRVGDGTVSPTGANALTIAAGTSTSSASFTLVRDNGNNKLVTLTATLHGTSQQFTVVMSSFDT